MHLFLFLPAVQELLEGKDEVCNCHINAFFSTLLLLNGRDIYGARQYLQSIVKCTVLGKKIRFYLKLSEEILFNLNIRITSFSVENSLAFNKHFQCVYCRSNCHSI